MSGMLEGKSALVTGGASGIGRATALAMVREGARVAVADRSEADAAETVARINAAGGQAAMLDPTEHGIRGNSHMIMQDRNNLQIADLILNWMAKHLAD